MDWVPYSIDPVLLSPTKKGRVSIPFVLSPKESGLGEWLLCRELNSGLDILSSHNAIDWQRRAIYYLPLCEHPTMFVTKSGVNLLWVEHHFRDIVFYIRRAKQNLEFLHTEEIYRNKKELFYSFHPGSIKNCVHEVFCPVIVRSTYGSVSLYFGAIGCPYPATPGFRVPKFFCTLEELPNGKLNFSEFPRIVMDTEPDTKESNLLIGITVPQQNEGVLLANRASFYFSDEDGLCKVSSQTHLYEGDGTWSTGYVNFVQECSGEYGVLFGVQEKEFDGGRVLFAHYIKHAQIQTRVYRREGE